MHVPNPIMLYKKIKNIVTFNPRMKYYRCKRWIRIQKGVLILVVNNENFAYVFEKYKNTVYGVAYNFLRNADDAEDILQEVFIRLLKSNTKFDNEEHLKAWLIRVTANASKTALSVRGKVELVPINEEIDGDEGLSYMSDSVKESEDTLLNAMLSLPDKYRTVLHLFYYEDYSVKEIAKALDIGESAVKVQLNRGRKQLKKILDAEGYNGF